MIANFHKNSRNIVVNIYFTINLVTRLNAVNTEICVKIIIR